MNDRVKVECVPSGKMAPMELLDDAMVFCPFCNKKVPFYAIRDALADHVIISNDPKIRELSGHAQSN